MFWLELVRPGLSTDSEQRGLRAVIPFDGVIMGVFSLLFFVVVVTS